VSVSVVLLTSVDFMRFALTSVFKFRTMRGSHQHRSGVGVVYSVLAIKTENY
jgi:hypothetical protein